MITNKNMIHEKPYKFKFFNKEIQVDEITVGQYVGILEGKPQAFLDVFGTDGMLMCQRQLENALKILLSDTEESLLESALKKGDVKKKGTDGGIKQEHFYILEGIMMKGLHQSRTEIRTWEFKYFSKMYDAIDVITGNRTYEDFKNHDKPDKKGINNLLK